MAIENSIVTIHRVPDLVIQSGPDWTAICGFILTAVVVAVGAWATIKSHEKTIGSQEKISAVNFLKASRQVWINDLRDTCSEFIASAMNVQRLKNANAAQATFHGTLPAEEFARIHSKWVSDHIESMKETKRLKAKIELLLNPDEADSKELMKAVIDALNNCNNEGNGAAAPCASIVEHCQVILKQEWERVKVGK